MKRLNLFLIFILAMVLVIPTRVDAATDQGLEWNIQENDEFHFKLNINGTSLIVEEIYFVIENTPPTIPDSIVEWSEIPYCDVGVFYANGTDLGMISLVFLGLINVGGAIEVPIGNFDILEQLLAAELTGETFNTDATTWGVSVVLDASATEEIVITASYSISDGFLATYQMSTYNKTTPGHYNLTSELSVIRDVENPIIVGPPDMEFYVDDINDDLTWYVSDANPAEYEITLNGSIIDSGNWTSDISDFSISLDNFEVGYYIYSITVSDIRTNTATDTVIVTIIESLVIVDDIATTDVGLFGMSWLSLLVTFGSIGVIVVVGLLILRSRK
ncbi:MAG: hypothetical protein ACTSV2_17020 [Candidatus Thorarchaeota archaeon]